MTIRKRLLFSMFVSLGFIVVPAFGQQTRYPFNDPNLPADKRIGNLLSLMTVDEKIDLLHGNGMPGWAGGPRPSTLSQGA